MITQTNTPGFQHLDVVYFIGIGGIGMSALARYFHAQGKTVMGYDKTATALTTELQLEGMEIHFDDRVPEIPQVVKLTPREKVLVVLTPAIPKDSAELAWFQREGYTIMKRAQVLGLISESSDTIAVAGTHGKTTTSSLIAHIMKHSGHGCNAFLGGISTNYQTNLLLDPTSHKVVVEADEFDRSFLTLSPALSVITSMDADHLDIYGTHDYMRASYQLFAERTRSGGTLLHRAGLPLRFAAPTPYAVCTYSITEPAAFTGSQIRVENGQYHFDLIAQQEDGSAVRLLENAVLGLAGRHNVENAVAACAICHLLGIDMEKIKEALATYTGVRRRFEYAFRSADRVLIDDYAHHPEELRAAISSARELFPDWPVTGVFQPHLFTRTRDFADAFARSLELLDRVILLPVYPARELPLPGIDSQMLLDKINIPSKKLVEKGELLAELAEVPQGVLMMLGAGDIDTLVQPVKNLYLR